jgi:hypothetical protein
MRQIVAEPLADVADGGEVDRDQHEQHRQPPRVSAKERKRRKMQAHGNPL